MKSYVFVGLLGLFLFIGKFEANKLSFFENFVIENVLKRLEFINLNRIYLNLISLCPLLF